MAVTVASDWDAGSLGLGSSSLLGDDDDGVTLGLGDRRN